MIVTCPSGLVVELRKLKTKEADILADAQAQKKGVMLDQLLQSVWVQTIDNGPYRFAGAPVWDEVLSGDRFYAQMMVRAETHGASYGFDVPCPICNHSIKWEVDLVNDLALKPLSAADKQVFMAGNVFKELGPDGRQYTFHLQTGKHEKKAQQILRANPASRITAALLARVDEIEGITDKRGYLSDLDLNVARELVMMLDEHDCGVETEIAIACDNCHSEVDLELPLGRREYWAPKIQRQKSAT